MKLGEKLQRLRRQSGLSQEQLAARITVSRQAVSKWELDEAMPDTENVIQLSRIFGVSCDYLLRDEVTEPDAQEPPRPVPPGDRHSPSANDRSDGLRPPGEAHLDERGWERNATVLSLVTCAIGLLLALGGWLQWQTTLPLIIGLIIELSGVALFELAVSRMSESSAIIRLNFYKKAVWLLAPIPMYGLCWWVFCHAIRPYPSMFELSTYISLDFAFSGMMTAVLAIKQQRLQRQAGEK